MVLTNTAADDEARIEARKDEIAMKGKAYREANKEKIAARSKAYYEAHKDEIAARRKARSDEEKTRQKAYQKAYREAHKEELAAYIKSYTAVHKDEETSKRKTSREIQKEFLNVVESQTELGNYDYELVIPIGDNPVMQKKMPQYPNIIICSNGCVLSSISMIPRKQFMLNGYMAVRTNNRGVEFVHRLVAKAFVPNTNRSNAHVHHKDGDKLNNDYSNLEWIEQSKHSKISLMEKNKRVVSAVNLGNSELKKHGFTINGWSVTESPEACCDAGSECKEDAT